MVNSKNQLCLINPLQGKVWVEVWKYFGVL